jgi:hypothetical protein
MTLISLVLWLLRIIKLFRCSCCCLFLILCSSLIICPLLSRSLSIAAWDLLHSCLYIHSLLWELLIIGLPKHLIKSWLLLLRWVKVATEIYRHSTHITTTKLHRLLLLNTLSKHSRLLLLIILGIRILHLLLLWLLLLLSSSVNIA